MYNISVSGLQNRKEQKMKRKAELPELLAPAGSYDALVAAVNAGADAVYIGGSSLNARAFAKNFSDEETERAVLYAHMHSVKAYVTLNTLIYDKEAEDFINYAGRLVALGIDAAIVADIGAASLLKKYVPSLPLHASTQMSLHSSDAVSTLSDFGFERVVLARELSYENILSAVRNTNTEIEIFLHGALCVSHSGQCLFSSLVGGRSGNRGECAQACRLPYNGKYPLSLRDLSLAEHIPELIDSGVASLKIEGRMKSPEYVYNTTKIYRKLLDEKRPANHGENAELKRIFSRCGFTDGYFTGKIGEKMTGVRTSNDKTESRKISPADISEHKIQIFANASFRAGVPCRLSFSDKRNTVTIYGDVPEKAKSAPLTEDSLKDRLSKTGETLFSLDKNDISLSVDDNINLAPYKINALRRSASFSLSELYMHRRQQPPVSYVSLSHTRMGEEQFHSALFMSANRFYEADTGFFDLSFVPLFKVNYDSDKVPGGVYLPPIVTDSERTAVLSEMKKAADFGIRYALCGNLCHFSLAKEIGMKIFGDFRLNITNSESAGVFSKLGAHGFILSPELNLASARDIGCGSVIVYGRIPLMLLERCFIRENGGCEKCENFCFTDRRGFVFPVMSEYPHRNVLLNSVVTYMGDRKKLLSKYKLNAQHFIFTKETAEEIKTVISDYINGESRENVRRIK